MSGLRDDARLRLRELSSQALLAMRQAEALQRELRLISREIDSVLCDDFAVKFPRKRWWRR